MPVSIFNPEVIIKSPFLPPIILITLSIVGLLLITLLHLISRRNSSKSAVPDKFDELYRKISEEIKYAVASKSVDLSVNVTELVDHAVEIWRIDQRINESAPSLSDNSLKSIENSVQRLKRYIEKYDIEIVDHTNQKYNDGLNLEVLSVEKDLSIPHPIIKKTIEPTIICKGQVVRKAKIILLTNN